MASNLYKIEQQLQASREKAEFVASRNLRRALQDESVATVYRALKETESEYVLYAHTEKEFENITKRIRELSDRLVSALKKIGMTPNDLTPRYSCEICHDTGIVGTEYCTCLKKRLLESEKQNIGIPVQVLPSFCEDTMKKEPKLQQTYEKMKRFCHQFPNVTKRNLLFTGATGGGKTYLAEMTAKEIASKGFSVIVISSFALNHLLLKHHTDFNESRPSLDPVIECDLLVIDDLGTEQIYRNVTKEYLLSVLSERIAAQRHTIITTNLNPQEILTRYGDRFYSRLMDKRIGVALQFPSLDLRLIK